MSQTQTQTATQTDLFQITRIEYWDVNIMDQMLRDTKSFTKKDLGNLSRYKKGRDGQNKNQVVYHYGKGCEKHKIGRLYVKGDEGLQAFPWDIRNPLLEKYYWDCDMENAHYIIVSKLAKEWGLPTEAIDIYINNRNECLQQLSDNRKFAKTAFLKALYGGDVKLYKQNYDDTDHFLNGDKSLLEKLTLETKRICEYAYGLEKYEVIVKMVKTAKKKNPRFSAFSFILQTEECKCLLALVEFMESQHRNVDILIHDGCEIRKLDGEQEFPTTLMRRAEKHIFDHVGYKFNLAIKPLKNNYKLTEKDTRIIVNNDKEAVEKLREKYQRYLVRGSDDWYVRNTHDNWWNKGNGFAKQLIMNADIWKRSDEKISYFGQNVSGVNKIYEMLEISHDMFPVNDNFLNDINRKTMGKVYYQDKYYDLKLQQFVDIGDDVPIIYIKRKAPKLDDITEEEIKDYLNNVLNMFANDKDRNGFLALEARAIGGYFLDKLFAVFMGLRNSGKGVIQEQNIKAWGDYVTFTNPPMCRSFNTGDASEQRWILTTRSHLARIAYVNETKGIDGKPLKLDGNVIKKEIASGGDPVLTRPHRGNEIAVVPTTTTFFHLNKLPECDTPDAFETMRFIHLPFCYGDENINDPMYKKADKDIKTKIAQNQRWADIFTLLVFRAWRDCKVQQSDLSDQSNVEKAEATGNIGTNPFVIFQERLQPVEGGFVRNDELLHIFSPCGWSNKKITIWLNAKGYKCESRKFKIKNVETGKTYRGIGGLNVIKDEDANSDEETIL